MESLGLYPLCCDLHPPHPIMLWAEPERGGRGGRCRLDCNLQERHRRMKVCTRLGRMLVFLG